ncbi:hypothetical protein GP486_007893 [Trichoglossum hirsutum]|uniref:DOMON domain-containing protein n=1 Tax=Trichoglossum hirsutum TaxID=265104 RepID=A0A9P8IGV5_9PEZI|nr:hypothetical protein GP486_007893 [Trichoglossum hirsutum]
MSRLSCLLLAVVVGLAGLVVASPSASSFVLNGGQNNNNFTFSVNVANESNDLYFRLEGPIGNSWLAVGAGDQMAGSLIFVVYAAQDNGNVTLSPRIGTGHVEPSFDEDIDVDLLDGSGIFNYTYVVKAVCHNCRRWNSGALNVNTTKQPWIYAVGPGRPFSSNSKTASIGLHDAYGEFTMNMIQATGAGGVPDLATSMSGAASVGSAHTSFNYFKLFHALFMSSVFVFLYPLGIISARVFGWIRIHVFKMVFATMLAFTGFFLAVYMSTLYNKIIGLVVMIAIVEQIVMGFIYHRTRAEERTPKVKVHSWIGQGILVLGIINGGL